MLNHVADICALAAYVIKSQEGRVPFPAIYTGMNQQVVIHKFLSRMLAVYG